MEIKKAPVIVTILLMMLGSFALGVHAAGTSKEITAYMRYDVGVQYNGEPVVMKNAKGERGYPISYSGPHLPAARPALPGGTWPSGNRAVNSR